MDNTEVLIKARKLVAKKWIQGRSEDGEGGYCTIGAIHYIGSPFNCGKDGPCAAIARAVGLGEKLIEHLADWNDDPARTQAQVLAAFDKAIGPRRRFLAWLRRWFRDGDRR